MKRNITLLLLFTLAVGMLVGFLVDRYLITPNQNVPIVVQDTPEPTNNNQEAVATTATTSEENGVSVATSTDEAVSFCQDLKSSIAGSENFNITTTIAPGELLTDGDMIRGCVYNVNDTYGGWAPFEGQVGSYTLTASDGTVLDEGPLSVVPTGTWMDLAIAEEDIEYGEDMFFDATGYSSGTLVLRNENASGESALDKEITISVTF